MKPTKEELERAAVAARRPGARVAPEAFGTARRLFFERSCSVTTTLGRLRESPAWVDTAELKLLADSNEVEVLADGSVRLIATETFIIRRDEVSDDLIRWFVKAKMIPSRRWDAPLVYTAYHAEHAGVRWLEVGDRVLLEGEFAFDELWEIVTGI